MLPKFRAAILTALFVSSLALSALAAPALPTSLKLTDENGKAQQPFAPGAKAVVLLFMFDQCPEVKAYSAEINRLFAKYGAKGVRCFLVNPVPDVDAKDTREYAVKNGWKRPVLLDRKMDLVKLTGATMTTEVAVYVPGKGLVYRGRIDDRYVSHGKTAEKIGTHDLDDVLGGVIAGKAPTPRTTHAFGCPLPQP